MDSKRLWLSCVVVGLLSMYGCEKEGPLERAGEQADEAVDAVKDQVEEAGDKIEAATD